VKLGATERVLPKYEERSVQQQRVGTVRATGARGSHDWAAKTEEML